MLLGCYWYSVKTQWLHEQACGTTSEEHSGVEQILYFSHQRYYYNQVDSFVMIDYSKKGSLIEWKVYIIPSQKNNENFQIFDKS